MSYTLRYVSFADLDRLCQFGLREPMHLCTCVNEDGGDGEGAGEGGDVKAVASPLEMLSLDTHRREVAGVHGTYAEKTPCQLCQKSSGHVFLVLMYRSRYCCDRRPGISSPTRSQK